MASITIRQLDETLKQQLRLRAASHGRSMEDEVRTILREAAGGEPQPPASHRQRPDGPPTAAMAHGTTAIADVTAAMVHATAGAMAGKDRRVLLIIGGGIAAYKSLDLIRRLRERGAKVRCVMTAAAQEFVTPLAAGALSGERVFTDLFDADGEFDVGHIRLARESDLIVVAPATADLMAKMAHGLADDLASAVLLATRTKI